MLSLRTMLLSAVVGIFCLLISGCSTTQAVAKSFIRTQSQVTLKAKDYETPAKIVGGTAEAFTPARSADSQQTSLLDAYAPIIVQGVEPEAKNSYAPDSDRIGQPRLNAAPGGGYAVAIDTQHPAMFASVEKVHVRGADLTQLVYVFWYPRHPVGLVEKGDIDGGVLRVTLDAAQRPALYEYVMACGCWHGLFVDERVETWAAQEFKTKEPGKKWFVEKAASNEDDWKVRDIVRSHGEKLRPVVFISAGKHECLAIQTEGVVKGLESLTARTFALQEYAVLEHLPVSGDATQQTASMFDPQGLVWGGRRKGEEKVFSKLDHGGWPRRLNAMKIHWDQESWNDANLLGKFVRIPRKCITPDATAAAQLR